MQLCSPLQLVCRALETCTLPIQAPTPNTGIQPVPVVLFESLQYPTPLHTAETSPTGRHNIQQAPLRSLTSAAWELYFSLMSVYLSMPYCFKKLFTTSLPPRCIFFSWSGLHASIDTDLQSGAMREQSMHAGQYEQKMGMTNRSAATDGCSRLWRQSPGVLVAHRTKLMCTPRPLCLPLHSRHMKTPYDTLAH